MSDHQDEPPDPAAQPGHDVSDEDDSGEVYKVRKIDADSDDRAEGDAGEERAAQDHAAQDHAAQEGAAQEGDAQEGDDPDLVIVEDSIPAAEPDAEPSAVTAEPSAAAAADDETDQSESPAAQPTGADDPGTPQAPEPSELDTPQVAEVAGGITRFQERWLAIQSEFVDNPHRSVDAAASLVQEVIESVVTELRQQESSLRSAWADSAADTEVLRQALVRYRGLLDRLAAM